jgi:hypothetical protein
MKTVAIGNSPFYYGVVENRKDPLELGRVKVRVLGVHTEDTTQLPTGDLPWATVVLPANNASTSGLGWSPNGITVGTWVLVYFSDGEDFQQPVVLGATVGINPVNPLTSSTINSVTSTSIKQTNAQSTIPTGTQGGITGTGLQSTSNHELGATSEKFESNGNPGAVAKDTYNSHSYGCWQMNTGPNDSGGTVQNFIKATKYAADFGGLQAGTQQFDLKWKEVAVREPTEFKAAQKEHIQRTIYGPAAGDLQPLLNVTGRGPAIADLIWSTSVQYGRSGGPKLIKKALNGKNVASLSDADIVSLVQDYKAANVGNTNAARIPAEKIALLKLCDSPPNPENTAVTPPAVNATGDSAEPVLTNTRIEETKTIKVGFRDPTGTYPKKKYRGEPDTNFLSTNKNINDTIVSFKKTSTVSGNGFKEPVTKYAAVYPFNKVNESESGHIIEIDDTPNAERVQIYHRAGSFIEFHPDGTIVKKSMKDNIEVVMADKGVYVFGNATVVIEGDATTKVFGNVKLLSEQNIDIMAGGNINIAAAGKLTLQSSGELTTLSNTRIVQDAPYVTQNGSGKSAISVDVGDKISGSIKNPEGPVPYDDEPEVTTTYATAAEYKAATGDVGEPGMTEAAKDTPLTPEEKAAVASILAAGGCGKPITQDTFEPNYPLSAHYKLADLTTGTALSGPKIRAQSGKTEKELVQNLVCLCSNVVELVYSKFGSRFTITSAFRQMGSNPSSQHPLGMAVDFQFAEATGANANKAVHLANEIKNLLPTWDQIILEYHGRNPVIHVSWSAPGTHKRSGKKEIKSTWNLSTFLPGLCDKNTKERIY